MTVKTATFSGNKDWLSAPADVAWLLPQIQQHVFHKTIESYDHLDFILGTNAATTVYSDVITVINNNS